MKVFEWDQIRGNFEQYDLETGGIVLRTDLTDKQVLENRQGLRTDHVVEALRRIVAELVRLEEERNK